MRSCHEMTELISAALDGELTDDERRELDDHMAFCPACGALFAELSGLNGAVGATAEVPEGFAKQVMDQIRGESAPAEDPVISLPVRRRRHIPWKGWAATAAVVAVVILGVSVLPGRVGLRSSDSSTGSRNGGSTAFDPSAVADVASGSPPQSVERSTEGSAEFDSSQDLYVPAPENLQPLPNAENGRPGEEPGAPQTPAAVFLPPEGTAPVIDIGGSARFCGVLILTGDVPPEELENFPAEKDGEGRLAYQVPAGVFFDIAAGLKEQNSSDYTYRSGDAEIDPTAEYGLILVETPSSAGP